MVAIILPGRNGPTIGGGTPGGSSFALAFTDHKEDASGGTPVTYTGILFGATDASRVVAVAISWRASNDTDTITGVTIGGVSATQVSGAYANGAGGILLADIWYATGVSGTSGDVVVTYSATSSRSSVAAYRIITGTPTPTNSAKNAGQPFGTATLSANLTVPASGAGFAIFGNRNQSTNTTWTNATRDYTVNIGTNLAGFSSATVAATNIVTANPGDGANGAAISMASWGP